MKSIPGSPLEGGSRLEKLRTVEYVEHMVQKGIGRYTPSSFLFALDYFSKALALTPLELSGGDPRFWHSRYSSGG